MEKLRLRLDDIQVDTFTLGGEHGARGTVEGQQNCTCDCCGPTYEGTCEGDHTCWISCGTNTCVDSCEFCWTINLETCPPLGCTYNGWHCLE